MRRRKAFDLTETKLRSAVTNGTKVLIGCDSRSAEMRRLKDLSDIHAADLGGAGNLSHSERVLINRASMLILQLELMDRRFAQTKDCEADTASLDTYQRITNTLRRLLETLGIQRRPKDVTPSLEQYLATKHANGAEADT